MKIKIDKIKKIEKYTFLEINGSEFGFVVRISNHSNLTNNFDNSHLPPNINLNPNKFKNKVEIKKELNLLIEKINELEISVETEYEDFIIEDDKDEVLDAVTDKAYHLIAEFELKWGW